MNLSAVRGQDILGTTWWTSVNSSATDAPMKLIFLLLQQHPPPKKKPTRQKATETGAKTKQQSKKITKPVTTQQN